jgi:hypothetical protein
MRQLAQHDSPEARVAMYRLLLDSAVLVGTVVAHTSEDTTGGFSLVFTDGDALPVFTGAAALRRWNGSVDTAVLLPAREALKLALGHRAKRVVINPGSATWGIVTRAELVALADGMIPLRDGSQVAAEDQEIQVRSPAQRPPDEGVLALTSTLRAEPAVEAAWLCDARHPATGRTELLAVVLLDPAADRDATLSRVARAVQHRDLSLFSLRMLAATNEWVTLLESGAGLEVYRRTSG